MNVPYPTWVMRGRNFLTTIPFVRCHEQVSILALARPCARFLERHHRCRGGAIPAVVTF